MAMADVALSSAGHGTASMDVPHTQNTAPVLEFRCLYTQDLRRKQKRWQDGRLKFHTFNKRVMVYDERSNFVGDTHWKGGLEFEEGEELELERGGILVEVGECVGKRDQDLFELVDKRVEERKERLAAKLGATPSRQTGPPSGSTPLLHKPLNTLLTPSGHYGRAVVPNTSPFEERQRLVTGEGEGNENGRPTKRRKQNEDAPSKSGYAQNLMGTKLTLDSTRPPSTASIRYEPLKMRIAPTQTPARTIDITEDDDEEDRGSDVRRTRIKGPGESALRPAKLQRKHKRSPAAKTGYASNLTGASLTLSCSDTMNSRLDKVQQKKAPVHVGRQEEDKDSSSTVEDEDSFVDIESFGKGLPTKAKKGSEVSSKAMNSPRARPEPQPRSSSPPVMEKLKPTSKPARSAQKSSRQESSIADPNPEAPVSALRIKARPPRKMMMLMERPSSRPIATGETSDNRRNKEPKGASSSSNEVVLSQATIQLNSFYQRQQEELQAGLNGKRPKVNLDGLSSSPDDSGIDHRTIDILLSRKKRLVAKEPVRPWVTNKPTADPKPARKNNEPVALNNHASHVHNSFGADPDLDRQDPPSIEPKQTAPSHEPVHRPIESIGSAHKRGPGLNTDIDEQASAARVSKQSLPLDRTNGKELQVPGAEPESPTDQQLPPRSYLKMDGTKEPSSSSVSAPERDHETANVHMPGPVTTSQKVTALVERSIQPPTSKDSQILEQRNDRPPAHVSSTVQVSDEHARAIKSSAGLADNYIVLQTVPTREQPLRPNLDQQKVEPNSSAVIMKPSPKSSPVMAITSDTAPNQNGEVTGSADGLAFQAEVPLPPPLIPRTAILRPHTTRLANPATRGKSLQSIAASTAEALAPATNVMPPPPPRISSRSERTIDRNEVGINVAAATPQDTVSGPWSREAFDLFGEWRPPGRAVGSSAITG
jgi:hypothetical protein